MKALPGSRPSAADVERLTTLIREQAARESAAAMATASEQAGRIRAAGQAEAMAIRAAAEREGEARGRRRAAELVAVARTQQRMNLLQVRESLIDAALTSARAALASRMTAADTLAAWIREALPSLPAGPVRLRMAANDTELLAAPLRTDLEAGRWTLHPEPASVPGGGVILESEDGHLCFDNSLEARIRRRHDRLRQLAAAILLLDAGPRGKP
jgi:vacuolar-type H+-ATPase subunit E/Vma4